MAARSKQNREAGLCASGKHLWTEGPHYCLECKREYDRKSYEENPEKEIGATRKWQAENAEKAQALGRKFREENPDYGRVWNENNAERNFAQYLKRTYNITIDDYNEMLSAQEGTCAICQEECPTWKRLSVDHNHETGKVRGLLCQPCNAGMGGLKDDIKRLQAAIAYLVERN